MTDVAVIEAWIVRRLRWAQLLGLAVGILGLALGLAVAEESGAPLALGLAVTLACGLVTGASTVALALTGTGSRTRSLFGGWTAEARRIERALGGSSEPLTAVQVDRAQRFAAVVQLVQASRGRSRIGIGLGLLVIGAGSALTGGGVLPLLLAAALFGLQITTSVLRSREGRQLHARALALRPVPSASGSIAVQDGS